MQRHDQVIDGSRARYVQQPSALGVAHLFVDRLVGDEHPVVAASGEHPAVVRPHHAVGDCSARLGRQPGDDGDRKFEALGGVDGHHPDGVVVVLGQDRVGDAGLRGLQRGPLKVAPDTVTAGVSPGAGLFEHESQAAPHVASIDAAECQVEQATLVGHGDEQVGGRHGADALGHRANMGESVADRMVRRVVRGARTRGSRCRRRTSTATARRRCSRTAGCAAPRPGQGCRWGRRRHVCQEQLADLGGGVHDRGVLGPVGSARPAAARSRAMAARCGWAAECRCRPVDRVVALRAPRRTPANHPPARP